MTRPLAAALIAAAAAAAPAAAQEVPPHRIAVTGQGEARAAPDMAVAEIAVSARDALPEAAFAAAAAQARAVLDVIAGAGIAATDVTTSGLSLGPVYAGGGNEPLRIEGYAARQSLSVTVRDLGGLGPLLAAVAGAGAAEIAGIAFDVADRDALRDAARRAAMEDAGRAARLLAEAAGVTLGRPAQIVLHGDHGGPRPMMRAEAASMDAMPVAPGELTVSASVAVEYALQ